MKNDRLSRCLGDIDEKFIDEAYTTLPPRLQPVF